MNEGQGAKQQIVEQIKQNSNILVTVNTSPTVDELTAALGLTLMLNKLNKHATAVVSGDIPPAITFLDPAKTFENTVDSLRDFIIALDKEKADHLRYKVEGDVVKIFITPYKTTLSENDLEFSQGDYNVEFVLALGVKDQAHLDKALEAHGRILHDATVATITCDETSSLGSISWHESGASSISEMFVSLSEALKTGEPILDEQVATALLTGIVASTDRFSNNKTSSKVMTMAAQLMAAGANQQLIAAKLEAAHEITGGDSVTSNDANKDGTTDLSEGESSKVSQENRTRKNKKKKERSDDGSVGGLAISHEHEGTLDEVAKEVIRENQESAAEHAEDMLAQQLETVAPITAAPVLAEELKDETVELAVDQSTPPPMAELPALEPTLGGTLNATADQAATDKRREEELDRNKTILSHGSPMQAAPSFANTPLNAANEVSLNEPGIPLIPETQPVVSIEPQFSAPTLADIDMQNRNATDSHIDAMAAVNAALDAAPVSEVSQPSFTPQPAIELPQPPVGLPPLPDFSAPPALPPLPPTPFDGPVGLPALPPQQPEQLGQLFGEMPPVPIPAPAPADPGQFKIPGQ